MVKLSKICDAAGAAFDGMGRAAIATSLDAETCAAAERLAEMMWWEQRARAVGLTLADLAAAPPAAPATTATGDGTQA